MAAVLHTERVDHTARADAAVKVMIVDDSLTVRTVFTRMLEREGGIELVAAVNTAERALEELGRSRIDVIMLDLEMPGMGGIEALPKIQKAAPKAQVLVISALTADGAEHTVKALSLGAADTMLKPQTGGFNDDYRVSLLKKIRALAGWDADSAAQHVATTPPLRATRITKRSDVVAIGASTGGIHALNQFLRKVPKNFDLPILITQHLPQSFIPVFATQMEMAANRPAVLADEGVELTRGKIFIAPGHGHMIVRKSGTRIVTGIAHHPVPSGCMPSVDPMFESLARVFEGRVAGVLLSGMGRDGTEGAEAIAAAGGAIFAQDAESCAVWGMPRAVTEMGLTIAALPPAELAEKVMASGGAGAWL